MAALYSERIELAFTIMLEAHGLQHRKACLGFEASHVTSVALIATDFGFDEDTIIAALLHDTLEDTDFISDLIGSRFGDHVLNMVLDVCEPAKHLPWLERKLSYVDQLRTIPRYDSLAIASTDKIHNFSRMVAGIESQSAAFIKAFNAGFDEMLWYHREVYDTLATRWNHRVLDAHQCQLNAFVTTVTSLSLVP